MFKTWMRSISSFAKLHTKYFFQEHTTTLFLRSSSSDSYSETLKNTLFAIMHPLPALLFSQFQMQI